MSIEKQIGARILSPNMMECVFQHKDSVLETIKRIRTVAYESQNAFCEHLLNNPNDAVMEARGYNNAVSILGSRGAGKTSVIMTLQEILQVGENAWKSAWDNGKFDISQIKPDNTVGNNIIMPILVPQDFTSGQSLLSWIIMQLCQKGEEIEKEIDEEYAHYFVKTGPLSRWVPKDRNEYTMDPLRECMNTLIRSLELRYRFDTKRAGVESDHVFEYMDNVKHDATVLVEMMKLISMIADYNREKFQRSQHYGASPIDHEPLLIFVIDDLDLAPERSQEILNLVLRYLQHPNVAILCGWNQELFQSHLCVDLFKTQGILNTSLLNTNLGFDDVFMKRQRKRVAVLDSARRLAMDNLKKAFPPSQRYEIRGLTTKQRASFPNSSLQAGDLKDQSFFSLIEETLLLGRGEQNESFLRNYCGERMLIYMRIFDNKARGLINVYRAFATLKRHLENWNGQEELDLTAELKSLLNTILHSNTHFVPYLRGIRDLIQIDKLALLPDAPDICKFYCKYSSIKTVLMSYKAKGTKNTTEYELEREYNYFPSLIIDVYILLNFVENMMLQLVGRPRYEHGGMEFSEVLNSINPSIEIKKEVPLNLAILAAGIEKISLFPETENFRINLVLLNNYENEGFSDQNYDFSGFHGYHRMLKAVNDLASYTDRESGNRLPRVDWLSSRAPEWTESMARLFDALTYSENHVIRLSKYRSYVIQGLGELNNEYLEDANNQDISAFRNMIPRLGKNGPVDITDELLDSIVYCIRQTGTFRRDFMLYLDSVKRRNEVILETNYIQKAYSFIDTCTLPIKGIGLDHKDFIDYKNQLESYRRQRAYGRGPLNIDVIEKAKETAESNISILLEYLEKCILDAFCSEYPKDGSEIKQFEYLLNASEAIAYYKGTWNLGTGLWSDTERSAIRTLVDLFRKNRFWFQINNTLELGDLGENLEKKGRQEYNTKLNTIKRWVTDNKKLFTDEDQNELSANISILEFAPKNIRRDKDAEELIYSVLMEAGSIIAQGCAYIGLSNSVLQDKNGDEQPNISWPIVEENWKEIGELTRPFVLYISRSTSDKNRRRTRFCH